MACGQEVLLTLRLLWGKPGYWVPSLLCLGLGVGAGVAASAAAYSLLLASLPFPEPTRLFVVRDIYRSPQSGVVEEYSVSATNFVAWREQSRAFDGMTAIRFGYLNLSGRGETQRLRSAAVSASFFSLLGVEPLLGRAFLAAEDRAGAAAQVVLLSHGLWRQLGADPAVVGQTLTLDGRPYLVVGVMPPGFRFPEEASNPQGTTIWLPIGVDPNRLPNSQWHQLMVVVRLLPGLPVERAQQELDTIAARLARDRPEANRGWGARLIPLREAMVGPIRPVLAGVVAVVGLVLLLACANLVNLRLAHMRARRGELAIRTALGGPRSSLLRRFLLESLVLAAAGGLLAFLFARFGVAFLRAAYPSQVGFLDRVQIGFPVLAFALLAALVTGTLVSLLPGLRSSGANPSQLLQNGGKRTTDEPAGRRLQKSLVVLEIALASTLLTLAGLGIKSLRQLQAVDPGFDLEEVLTLGVALPDWRFSGPAQRTAYVERALDRLRAVPGVSACAITTSLPVGMGEVKARFVLESAELQGSEEIPSAHYRQVSPEYFRTLGIPLVHGRFFSEGDRADAPGVAIVSAEMARHFWPRQDPIGKRLKRWSPELDNPWLTVVGVVQDVRDAGLEAGLEPAWYLPSLQHDFQWIRFVVRTDGDPVALAPSIRSALLGVEPDLALYEVRTLADMAAESLASRRIATRLLGLFAALGIVLAAAGVYGVFSHLVGQRWREMGIRLALGAAPRDIQGLVLREGLALAVGGLLFGLTGALWLGKLFSSLLFEVSIGDPATLSGACFLMMATAAAACLMPARQARSVPVVTILNE